MLNYSEFILENKEEFRLYYSLKFRTILERIKSNNNNKIANLLLKAENNNIYRGKFTLIDVTDKNNFISFIQTNRILRKNPDLNSDLREQGILPTDIHLNNKGNEFWETGRTEMAIGRWTRKVFTDILQKSLSSTVLNNSELEEFVNQYKATYDYFNNIKLELVEGEEIRHWYCEFNYENQRGQLGNSCMRQVQKYSFFDIYVYNPDVCKLLILKSESDNTKIKGRALIWKLTDGSYYQDRVYTNNESDRKIFENWAREKNMRYHWSDSGYNMTVQLGNYTYLKYPYMDTFVAYNPTTNQLKNDEDLWPDQGFYLLQNVNGGYQHDQVVWSEYEEDYIDREDAVLDVNGEWISQRNAIYVDSRDAWYTPDADEIVWSDWFQDHFHNDDVVYSDSLNDYLMINNPEIIEIVVSKNGKDYVPKSKIDIYFEFDGKYYSRSNWVKDPYNENKLIDLYEYSEESPTVNTPQNRNILLKKLEEEFGDDVTKLKSKLVKIYLNKKFNLEDVKNEIENNEIYKEKLKGVWWGLANQHKVNVDLMIPILFASIYSGNVNDLYENLDVYGDEIKNKFKTWQHYDRRLTNLIFRFTQSFNFDTFNNDVYKIWLYFNL